MEAESEKNVIAGNIVVQIIGRMMVLIMSLVTIKLISNYVGTEGTGYYNTIITYLSFFIAIADFGLFSIAVREMSKRPEEQKKLIDNIFTIRIVSAFIVTIVAVTIAQFTSYPEIIKGGVLIASVFLFFNLTGSVFDMIFQTKLEMKKTALADVIGKIISLSVLFLVVKFQMGFYWVMATVSLATITVIFVKFLQANEKELPQFRYDPKIVKEIVKLSLPFGMIFILNNFYFKVDTLILFHFKGASEVGIYAVAYRVLETTMFAAAYLSYSLKPLLSATIESNKEKAARAASSGMIFLLATSLVVSVLCIPFSKEIIIFLSNETFVAGAPVIITLVFASIFIYLNTLMSEILIAKDSRKYLLLMAVIVLTFNISLNIIFIPKYSFYAAGIITLASEILLFTLGFLKARLILPIKIDFARIFKLLLSATISIIIGFGLKSLGLYFIASMVISLGFYLAISYTINAVPKDLINSYLYSLKSKWIT